MNATACPEARTAPTITWRLRAYHLGRDLIITVIAGAYAWRLDEPNARNSAPAATYPACLAAARAALGLPAIGESGQHITADCLEA